MKAIITMILILSTVVTVAADSSLDSYNKKYTTALDKLTSKSKSSEVSLGKEALKGLKSLEKKYKKSGDLNNVLAVRKLLEEYEEDPHKLTELHKSPVAAVQALLTRLQVRIKIRKATLATEVRRLKKSYKTALTKRIKVLTQADKLEEAVAFNNELKLLDAKPEVKKPVAVREVAKEEAEYLGAWQSTWKHGKATHTLIKGGSVFYEEGDHYTAHGTWKKTAKGIEVKMGGYPVFLMPFPLNEKRQKCIQSGKVLYLVKVK